MPCAPYSSLDQHILREAHTTHHLIAVINVHAFDGDPQNTREIEYKVANCLMESLTSTYTAILRHCLGRQLEADDFDRRT